MHSLGKTLLAFALLDFVLQGQTCLYSGYLLTPYFCIPVPYDEKDISFLVLVLEGFARESNGNPLQCSCLESPRNGEAWWAAFYGVAQSRTRLKQLSSSSSNSWIYAQEWDCWIIW